MTSASAWIYIVLGIALVAAAAPYGLARSTTARRKALDRFARRIDLALPTTPIEDERVGMRLAARERFIAIGGGIGIGIAVLATVLLPSFHDDAFSLLGIFALTIAGIGFGAALSAFATTRELPNDVPRIARLSTPTLRDYLPALEYVGTIVVVVGAVVVPIVALPIGLLYTGLDPADTVTPIVLSFLAVASLVAVLFVARRLLDRGQRAGSTLELAWDDAIRATALRDLISVPLILGFAGMLVPLVTIINDVRVVRPYTDVDNVIAVGSVIVVCIVTFVALIAAIVSATSKPDRHYRARLWPTPDSPVPSDGAAPSGDSTAPRATGDAR